MVIDPLVYVANGSQWGRKAQRKVEFHMNPKEKSRAYFSLCKSLFLKKRKKRKKERGKEWKWRMRLKSHLAVYLLTPHCYIIKMSKWRFGVPDFIYFPLNSNVFPRAPGLCIIISRYLAITSSYHNLFHIYIYILAVVYGESIVKRGTITKEVKLDRSRDEIVKS